MCSCLYARVHACVLYVRVLNQYLHSACHFSWVSQFDRMFFSPCVNDVCKVYTVYVQYETNGETLKLILSSIAGSLGCNL